MEKFYAHTDTSVNKPLFVTLIIITCLIVLGTIVRAENRDEIVAEVVDSINSQTESVQVTYTDGEITVIETNMMATNNNTYLMATRPPIVEEHGEVISNPLAGNEEENVTSEEITKETAETVEEVVTAETEQIEETLDAEEIAELLSDPYEFFTEYTDLAADSGVTAKALDACTEYYAPFQDFENRFLGKGEVFMEAERQSGIDALWLYAVSVYESGWGTSDLALNRANYYGIGAWDIDINRAKVMGTDFEEGIINGAIWIKEHYYDKGLTYMQAMNSIPNYSYAPGNEIWIPTIVDFINNFRSNWR